MNINSVKNCSGCFLCRSVCPKKCINITTDNLGHLNPYIDTEACINCGVCSKMCPEMTALELSPIEKVYAGWDKNEKSRIKSSSGGLATLLAQQMIKDGGVVYGCAFAQPLDFKHIRCDSLNALEKLRGSKYVQSKTYECWNLLQNDIKKRIKVLFIGTPCQVAAARRLCKDNELLYTIDLICHGVPSVDILKESLPNYVKQTDIDNITFRDSTNFQLKFLNEESITIYTRPLHKDWYLKGFFTALFYRNSCYNCKYARTERVGDITLGDFWGVQESTIKTDTDNGISAICVNSNKGKILVQSIKQYANIIEREVNEVEKENKQLNHPSHKSIRSDLFKKFIKVFNFNAAVKLSLPEIALKSLFVSLLEGIKLKKSK